MRRLPLVVGSLGLFVGAAVLVAILVATAGPPPLEIVQSWTRSRNAGDVETAMSYLAHDANVFGFSIASPSRRDQTRGILEAQATAGWTIEESDCSTAGESVTCRYRMHDEVLRRWGMAFTGVHEYVVHDGKLASSKRFHDLASRDQVYAALDAFREWVRVTHPDLLYVIWSDAQSVTYATPEGAEAMLNLLDEYDRRQD